MASSLPRNAVRVDPSAVPGGALTVDLLDAADGDSVVAYKSRHGRTQWTLPATVTGPAEFYFANVDVWASLKVNDQEVAAGGGVVAHVTAAESATGVLMRPVMDADELAGLAGSLPTPTTGDAGKVLTVTEAEDGYELATPASGGSSAGLVHHTLDFSFDTAGLEDGLTIFTPEAGDLILDAWFEIPEEWDGTSPTGDLGCYDGDGSGLLAYGSSTVDMTVGSSGEDQYGPIRGNAAMVGGAGSLAAVSAAYPQPVCPIRLMDATPVKVWVSQDGIKGGDPVDDATQGQATIHVLVVPFA